MNIKNNYDEYGILILENVYSDKEYESIMNELSNLYSLRMFLDPEHTSSALYDDGTPKKKNVALFLDDLYSQRGRMLSKILTITEERLLSVETKQIYSELNSVCKTIFNVNRHSTLISYYENNDEYDFHKDTCAFTTLSYFYKDPKSFSGGDIIFNVDKEEIKVEIDKNISIIFPSVYEHRVTKVNMSESNLDMKGRFSISQFLHISM